MFMIPLRPPVWKVPSGSGLSSGSDYLPYILHEFCQQFHFEVGSAVFGRNDTENTDHFTNEDDMPSLLHRHRAKQGALR